MPCPSGAEGVEAKAVKAGAVKAVEAVAMEAVAMEAEETVTSHWPNQTAGKKISGCRP